MNCCVKINVGLNAYMAAFQYLKEYADVFDLQFLLQKNRKYGILA